MVLKTHKCRLLVGSYGYETVKRHVPELEAKLDQACHRLVSDAFSPGPWTAHGSEQELSPLPVEKSATDK